MRHTWASRGYQSILLVGVCATSLYLINPVSSPQNNFLGDELEIKRASEAGGYASSWSDSISDTSLDKWRPLNTLFITTVIRFLPHTYGGLSWLSSVLMLLLATCFYVIVSKLSDLSQLRVAGRVRLITQLGTLVITSSHFAYFARTGIFGFLELMPLTLSLVGFLFFQRAIQNGNLGTAAISALSVASAGLIHERYHIVSIAFALLASHRLNRIKNRWRISCCFLVGPLVFVVAIVLLSFNGLRGGGTYPLSSTFGVWIVFRLALAALHVFGGAGGESVFFELESPYRFINNQTFWYNYQLCIPALLVLGAVVPAGYLLIVRRRKRAVSDEAMGSHETRCGSALAGRDAIVVALALLLPAATVIERIESRWLYGSLTFLTVGVCLLSGSQRSPAQVRAGCLTALLLLAVGNFLHRNSFQEYDYWRLRSVKVLNAVRTEEPASGYWSLLVDTPGTDNPNIFLPWALGFGAALMDLNNAPIQILWGNELSSQCLSPCLTFSVYDSSEEFIDERRVANQRINHVWK